MFFEETPPRAAVSAQGLGYVPIEQSHGSDSTSPSKDQQETSLPPGLLGDVARFIYAAAPYPNHDIALAGAIGFLSGLTGRAYNTFTGAGLNQYLLVLAITGLGKEAIAGGVSKLTAAVSASVPSVIDFKGPGHIASAAGLIKALAKSPCFVSIIGEFGHKLKVMASPRASLNDVALKAALLDLYGKSGQGNVLDGMAYSDTAKNTVAIDSPALTIIGESVPEVFFEAVDEGVVADGLLPRFLLFSVQEKRPYLNPSPAISPDPALTQAIADLTATCLQFAHSRRANLVPIDAEAAETFQRFERHCTDQINAANSEVIRQLWNRAHLKALKLATLCAVGINCHNPLVTLNETMWATTLVASQTQSLLARFEEGETGTVAGDEAKQLSDLIRVVATYLSEPFDLSDRYGGITFEMHRDGVVSETFLSRRLTKQASYRHDRLGSTYALKRALKNLLDGDEVREVPKTQMIARYGCHPRSFVVSNPSRSVEAYQKATQGGRRR